MKNTQNVENAKRILRGSIEYEFKRGILEVRDYRGINGSFALDLSKLDVETFEALQPDEEDEEDWD